MTLPEEGLQQDGLTSNEWDELNHIADIEVHSDQLSKYILLFSLFPEIQSYKSADM